MLSLAGKRILDLVIILLTAVIWLPLMIVIMYGIKVIAPGPAFYRQRRIGLRGRPFLIFKFRSMKVNAETLSHEEYLERLMREDTPMTKLDASDRRLIPLGYLLRATGLDEFAADLQCPAG
jgi:lipopolysaccharide/colanic/teichoic acid biosynthesis glycosyltransferase